MFCSGISCSTKKGRQHSTDHKEKLYVPTRLNIPTVLATSVSSGPGASLRTLNNMLQPLPLVRGSRNSEGLGPRKASPLRVYHPTLLNSILVIFNLSHGDNFKPVFLGSISASIMSVLFQRPQTPWKTKDKSTLRLIVAISPNPASLRKRCHHKKMAQPVSTVSRTRREVCAVSSWWQGSLGLPRELKTARGTSGSLLWHIPDHFGTQFGNQSHDPGWYRQVQWSHRNQSLSLANPGTHVHARTMAFSWFHLADVSQTGRDETNVTSFWSIKSWKSSSTSKSNLSRLCPPGKCIWWVEIPLFKF